MSNKANEILLVCIGEHKSSPFYFVHKSAHGQVELFKIELDEYGYSESGRYYGRGMPLYAVELTSDNGGYFNTCMRSASRPDLSNEIKKLYPNMKVKWNYDLSDIDN